MISVLYVNILIGVLICLFPCVLSWFLGSMNKPIFDLSRSIWLKKKKRKKESWKKWNMRRKRVCNIHDDKVRLGTSPWEHWARAWNVKVEKIRKPTISPMLQPPTPTHIPVSMRTVSWCDVTKLQLLLGLQEVGYTDVMLRGSKAALCKPSGALLPMSLMPFVEHHGAEFGLCRGGFIFSSPLVLHELWNLTAR